MTAVPALVPLRIVPVPGPKLAPSPLPGQPFPRDIADDRFVQPSLDFGSPVAVAVADEDEDDDLPDHHRAPDPAQIIQPLATALVEVLAGRRPVVQLVRWTSPGVYAALTARSTVAYRRRLTHPGGPVRVAVRRVVLTQPGDGIVEASIIVIDGVRVRAIAVRLRANGHRWVIEALQVG